jgi:hypothetical protein
MQESFVILRIMVLVSATLIWIVGEAVQGEYFNVMDYGAKGDRVTDDSMVILPYSLVNEKLI